MNAKHHVYAIYKGEDLIDMGTLPEMAKRRGIKTANLRYMHTPTYARRTSDEHGTRVVRVEEDE